jgi:vancomycin resistance protein VanJ
MTSFTVTCECGERFHGDDGSAGRRVRCRRCNRVVELEPPPSVEPPPRAAARSAPGRHHARVRRSMSRPARLLHVLSWTYLAATIAIAAVMWSFGDLWWPATALLFMGRWMFLLPLVVVVPAALFLRRRLLFPLLLGALVTLGPIMGGRIGAGRLLPTPGGMPLRVVTFNVGGGQMIADDLPLLLELWSADVVLFQECGEALATMTERIRGWNGHHAGPLCMLTRFPIVRVEPMDRSALERVKRDQAAGIGGAGFVVRYTLGTPRGPINVTNIHLETARKGFEGLMSGDVEQLRLNTMLRNIESTLARRWVDAARGPTLVAGDFNTPVESRIFQDHWGDFADAFTRVGTGLGTTKYNGWIRINIDHVLTDDAWRAVTARAWRDLGSDHRAMVADLVLLGR